MSTYLGYDVLDIKTHNRRGDTPESIERGIRVLDPGTTKRYQDTHTVAPQPSRPFVWTCFNWAEVAVMRTFLEARKGRAIPFWLPSYQQDLSLAADLASAATSATIRWVGYKLHQFPGSGARRHLALYSPVHGAAMQLVKVADATDPNDQVTESIALGTAASRLYPAASTVISFLKLCRLDSDRVSFTWLDKVHAECVVPIREIPMEAAA